MDTNELFDKQYVNKLLELLLFEKNNNISNGLYDMTQTIMSYHSNKIEGSTLSYNDTWELYDKGEFLSENTIKSQDITDAQGHFLMFDKMLEGINDKISNDMLCEWHSALKSGSYEDKKKNYNIGAFKSLENTIGGMIHTSPVSEVETDMKRYFSAYLDRASLGHSFQSLGISHHSFEMIHPFQDGNGRIGRMLLFRQCIDNGIVPCIITEDLKNDYIKALKDMSFYDSAGELLQEILKQASKTYYEISNRFVKTFSNNNHPVMEEANIHHRSR